MRSILNRAARLASCRAWKAFLTRGNTWFFVEGHLYIFDPEGTRRVRDSTKNHPFPGNNGRLFKKVFSNWKQAEGHQRSVLISGLGRFGNGIQQFINARTFATALDAHSVMFYPNKNMIESGLRHLLGGNLHPLQGAFRNSPLKTQTIWRSDFFESGSLRHSFDEPSSREMLDLLRSLYKHLIDGEQLDKDVLTVHLRSGDVFSERPHPAYGQPPLAFYERVIDSKQWKQIVVVAEDESNPCLESLIRYSSEKGLPTEVVGEAFAEATMAISRSSHLVASRGTFVPALVYLSNTPKVIYQFEEPIDYIPNTAKNKYRTIFDAGGGYVREIYGRNWRNTFQQKKLMTSYSKQHLSELRGSE